MFFAYAGLLDLYILLQFKYLICLYGLTQFSSSDVLSCHIIEENCLHSPLSSFSSCLLLHNFKGILLFLLREVLQYIQAVFDSMKNFFCLCDFREPEFIEEYNICVCIYIYV